MPLTVSLHKLPDTFTRHLSPGWEWAYSTLTVSARRMARRRVQALNGDTLRFLVSLLQLPRRQEVQEEAMTMSLCG